VQNGIFTSKKYTETRRKSGKGKRHGKGVREEKRENSLITEGSRRILWIKAERKEEEKTIEKIKKRKEDNMKKEIRKTI
jgi:hypothetical protein